MQEGHFSSNICETSFNLSKTVLNFKMNDIGQFIAMLVLCIVIVAYHPKLLLSGK